MAININNINSQNQVKRTLDTNVSTQKQDQQSATKNIKSTQTDSVLLTTQAKNLKELQKKSSTSSGINQSKVNELKKAIASGNYKVDADKLAANLANFEFNL